MKTLYALARHVQEALKRSGFRAGKRGVSSGKSPAKAKPGYVVEITPVWFADNGGMPRGQHRIYVTHIGNHRDLYVAKYRSTLVHAGFSVESATRGDSFKREFLWIK